MSRNGSLLTEAKGRFAETIVSTLLEYAGYRVLRLGVEEIVSEVKAGVARGEQYLKLPQQLRTAPDFLVVDPATGDCTLLEVKFRRVFGESVAAELHATLSRQEACWPGCVTAIVCAAPEELTSSPDIRQFIGCLRGSDLHRLVEPHRLTRWQRLRTIGGVFERVLEKDRFYTEAEALVAPIRGWG